MHDDRAYTMAMGAFALSKLRRADLNEVKEDKGELSSTFQFRRPKLRSY